MDTNAVQVLGMFFSMVTAIAWAYQAKKSSEIQKLTLDTNRLTQESKAVSEGNAVSLVRVKEQGNENAKAIEHTRMQNNDLAAAVEDTKVQNDNLAEQVGHVHICVETKAAELKDVVKETVPAAVKDVVPAAIKEVMPAAIKETLPQAIATLKE
jgi:hypothetical protein